MSVNVSVYLEELQSDGTTWKLVDDKPLTSRIKYIITEYNDIPTIKWDSLSLGLKDLYKKNENGEMYMTFHATTISDLERKSSAELAKIYTKLNTIVTALGVKCTHNDDGDEIEWDSEEDDGNTGLTYQINKDLIIDLQCEMDRIRNIGQRETLDMFIEEHLEWGAAHRIILAVG